MNSEITVLNEMLEEQRKHIAELVRQVEDWRLQFDLVLNERNEAMDENASAKSVHKALVRNLTSMSEFAGKMLRERDEARAERDEAQDERRHAVAALSEQVDTLRQERAEMQRMVCRALYTDPLMQRNHAKVCGWRCFDVTERRQPDATTDETSQEAP